MSSLPLSNYLRTNRKRLGLSQVEVAFLLGTQTGAQVCRHEQFAREPSLETALALEVIYQKPVRDLFAGLYAKVEQEVGERANVLAHKTSLQKTDPRTNRKRQMLANMASGQSQVALNIS
jgi:transcriptional regulator with XRE-family HTH domain